MVKTGLVTTYRYRIAVYFSRGVNFCLFSRIDQYRQNKFCQSKSVHAKILIKVLNPHTSSLFMFVNVILMEFLTYSISYLYS